MQEINILDLNLELYTTVHSYSQRLIGQYMNQILLKTVFISAFMGLQTLYELSSKDCLTFYLFSSMPFCLKI